MSCQAFAMASSTSTTQRIIISHSTTIIVNSAPVETRAFRPKLTSFVNRSKKPLAKQTFEKTRHGFRRRPAPTQSLFSVNFLHPFFCKKDQTHELRVWTQILHRDGAKSKRAALWRRQCRPKGSTLRLMRYAHSTRIMCADGFIFERKKS
jgi:hypothetical protein